MRKYNILLLAAFVAGSSGAVSAKGLSGVVLDKRNGIYWQDNADSKESSQDWDDAVEYCDKLKLAGMEHWRLPTFKELFSIVDYNRIKPAINPVFDFTQEGTYWTSTTFATNISRAWTIDFRTGKSFYSYKTTNHAVRCVKNVPEAAAKENK
ncbi:DUF1566 domain-containing protein [Sulfurovum sp.]|uniref:Lcl C-terminal domain-containing protein n=1 Tax=Sulfurovum sp. TaxID=1969726 RepID=UPI0025F42BA4|nr:DUF1566 domain-containing protein [Sulfurovum sp.]